MNGTLKALVGVLAGQVLILLLLVVTLACTATSHNKVAQVSMQEHWQEFEATAYTHNDPGCNRLTKTEFELTPGARIVAVDPKVIPLGSRVEIWGYGIFYAEDIGGVIKGNKIDVYLTDRHAALQFGRRKVKVKVIKEE